MRRRRHRRSVQLSPLAGAFVGYARQKVHQAAALTRTQVRQCLGLDVAHDAVQARQRSATSSRQRNNVLPPVRCRSASSNQSTLVKATDSQRHVSSIQRD